MTAWVSVTANNSDINNNKILLAFGRFLALQTC